MPLFLLLSQQRMKSEFHLLSKRGFLMRKNTANNQLWFDDSWLWRLLSVEEISSWTISKAILNKAIGIVMIVEVLWPPELINCPTEHQKFSQTSYGTPKNKDAWDS